MLNIPVRGEENAVLQLTAMLNGLQLPDDCLQNVAPALLLLFSILLSVRVLPICIHSTNSMAPSCLSAELPYGWEEIDDPQYGTYYVE